MERMIKALKQRRRGAAGLEWSVQSVVIFMIFVLLLFGLFLTLTFVNFGSLANQIAGDLNMRQTGYRTAMRDCSIGSTRNALNQKESSALGNISSKDIRAKVTIVNETPELRAAVYCSIAKAAPRFKMPFAAINEIKVVPSRPVIATDGAKMAGNQIVVEIYYTLTTESYSTGFKGSSSTNQFRIKTIGSTVIS